MKQICLAILLAFAPLFLLAQNDGEVSKNFKKNTRELRTMCQLDEHTWLTQTILTDNNFEVDAINDQMEVVWTAQLEGHPHFVGKLKNKVIVIASTEYSVMASYNSTYKAYLLNKESGETVAEKVVSDRQDVLSLPYFSTSADGSYFKMLVRYNGMERRARMAIAPVALFTIKKTTQNYMSAKELDLIELNENLDVTSTIKPPVTDGVLYSVKFNEKGAMFLLWHTAKSIRYEKYDPGKSTPIVVEQPIELEIPVDLETDKFFTCIPKSNPDVLFSSIMVKEKHGDLNLMVTKVDFKTQTQQTVSDAFSSDRVNQIEKNAPVLGKKLGKPDIGNHNELQLRGIRESGGKVVTEIYGDRTYVGTGINSGVSKTTQKSVVFNVFSDDLKPLSVAVFPNDNANWHTPEPGFTIRENVLYVVATGPSSNKPIYGEYDLNEGQWNRTELLGKKPLNSDDVAQGDNIMWFADGFIIPYADYNTILMGRNSINYHLQHITMGN